MKSDQRIIAMPIPPRFREWVQFFLGRLKDGEDPWELVWEFTRSKAEAAELFFLAMENAASIFPHLSEFQAATGLKVLLTNTLSSNPFEMTGASAKLGGYFQVASVEHYLIVDPNRRSVIHHCSQAKDTILTRLVNTGTIVLAPPGITVEVGKLFA